jgi:Carboxypeptidase regulatory-like domain
LGACLEEIGKQHVGGSIKTRFRTSGPLCFLLLLLLISFDLAPAQSDTGGSVAGQIAGISGNPFRALVTLLNAATGARIQALSDARGNFRFAEVAPGNYSVRINAPGAAPWRAYNITVEIGRTTLLAPRMIVAYIDPRPRKKNEFHAPQADLTPAVRNNVDQDFIASLPSSVGHWSAFAALAAGAAPDADGTSALSFRGLSPLMNGITLDGADNTLAFHARERGTASGYAIAQSAVSQFQVSTSNFSAEYGRAAGGIINSITKSGGNVLHLEASFYDRNAAWGAMNAWTRIMQVEPAGTTITSTGAPVMYLNGQPITYIDAPYKAPDQRLHGSFNAGGPIRRDKLFWFFATEYHYRDFPAVARANEPETFFAAPSAQTIQTLGSRIATSANPIVTNCATSPSDLNAQVLCAYSKVLNQLNEILGTVPRTATQMIFFPKLDWRANNRIHLIGQYNYMRHSSPNGTLIGATEPDGIGSFGNSSSSESAAVVRLEYFFTPALLTSFRYQFSRDLLSQLAAAPTSFEQQFAANSYGRSPQISIDRSSGFTFGTLSTQSKSQYPLETRQQLADSVTWIHNLHAFRFGYDYNHITDAINGVNGQNGEYSYSSLANFIADMLAPNSCDGTTTGSARSARTYFYRPLDAGAPPFPYVFAATETPYTNPNAPDALSSAPNAVYFDHHFQNPQIDQAELSLQRQLGQRTALTLTYMSSYGRELPQFIDRNIDLSSVATLNYILNFTTNPQHLGPLKNNFTTPFYVARVNPDYGSITDIISESNSSYQGAVIRLTRRTERAIDLNAAYTYSHAIDDNQNEATFANFNNVYDPSDLALEHGTSNFDIRQRASGGIVAHVPWRFNGFAGSLLNGYMLSTYGEWRTGLPYTMRTMGSVPVSECSYQEWLQAGGPNGGANCVISTINPGGVITGTGVPIPGIGASLNGSGGEDLIPQVGRNTFRYPGAIGLDVRAGKRTSITDHIAVEFFAEAFNALNHPNVTNIQTIGYSIANDPTNTGTATLSYLTGLKTYTTTESNGSTQTQLIGSPTAAFGDTTATNNNALYHDRQIQLGCKLFF